MQDNLMDSAIKQAAACAREKYAGEDKRIGKGLLIALNRGVKLGPEWTGSELSLVQSDSNREVFYNVRASSRWCDCPDHSNAPGGRCKHVWAVYFCRIAHTALTLHGEEL